MFVVKEVRKVVKSKNHIKKKTNQLTEVLLFAWLVLSLFTE